MKVALWVLGNQLFPWEKVAPVVAAHGIKAVYMAESAELCTYYRFHQHKLVLFLASMRKYADALRSRGLEVFYRPLEGADAHAGAYEDGLVAWCRAHGVDGLVHAEIEDRWFEARAGAALAAAGLRAVAYPSPMFLTPREEFASYLRAHSRPFMRTFYERQRKRLGILVQGGEPAGGRWSFDEENRRPLPSGVRPTPVPAVPLDGTVRAAIALVERRFGDHPGRAREFWLPTDRTGHLAWLDRFIAENLDDFGPYQDALAPGSDFVFHSLLTPGLNLGLITPDEVLDRVLARTDGRLASVEGFVRQVVGWREFVRGVDRFLGAGQETANFFDHRRGLSHAWYRGHTGIPPLDQAIGKAERFGYAHHIERLMVLGNMMLLCEIAPGEAYRWFMEMFVDSSDWVMGPNVYGMGIFSDGGIFATKPYVCGSNYYRKMGKYAKGPWCDAVDGLYWSFVDRHRRFFGANPRTSMAVRALERMDGARKRAIFARGAALKDALTTERAA